jgi:ABC-2 type transport system ATP-binding protein
MSIEVKNLTKIFGQQKAVNDITFSLSKGEIVGFLGPNGAGKSTTMKMITGYLEPDEGTMTVSGIDVLKHPLEVKKKVGYLPESNALYYDMYVREYLGFLSEIHAVSNRKQRIEEVISLTGLTAESKKKIGQLSKGYKQRVGIAAALIHNPEVLILDEPTSGLDPNQIIEIRNVIKEQGKDKLVLFSSHILQEVEAICDRVIIINKGKLVADDKLANLQNINRNIQTVIVQFAEKVDKTLLQNLKDAEKVEEMQNTGFQIQTFKADSVRKGLLSLALEHNLNIVSLQTQNQSLETIFRTLTSAPSVPETIV